MNYTQVKSFNQSKGGNKAGLCLQNVRLGYEIPARYDDAWTAWLNTEQHKDRNIPSGVDVPVYFSYTTTIGGVRKNYGHIGVRLSNGRFWSDGRTYDSVAAYENNHAPVYVGWGESVNNVRVIKGGTVEKTIYKPTRADITKAWKELYGTTPSEHNYKTYMAKDISWMWHDFAYELKKQLDAEKKKPVSVNRASVIDYINKNLK